MRQIYRSEVRRTESAPPFQQIFDNPVEPGKIIEVTNIFLTYTAMASDDIGRFYIQSGGQKIYLGEGKAVTTYGSIYWSGRAFAGEHDQVGVYTRNTDATNLIVLCTMGILWDLECWRKSGGV